MVSFTIDMLGWTPNKGKPIIGHPRVQLPNQRLGMLDKLSHNAHNPDRLSQGAMQNTLDKKGLQSPKSLDKESFIKKRTYGQAKLHWSDNKRTSWTTRELLHATEG